MKILVYGVLGKFDYWNIKYRIKEETVNARLPSEALVKYYKSKGYETDYILFAPESLITLAEKDSEKAKEYLSNGGLEECVREKANFVDLDFEIVLIPSLGWYFEKDRDRYSVNFVNYPRGIRAVATLYFLKRSVGYDKIVLDISTGQNLYISVLLDSFRDLIVNTKLRNLFWKNRNPEICILEAPPILGKKSANYEYKLHIRKYDVRVFFDFPLDKPSLPDVGKIVNNKEIIRKYREELEEYKKYIRNYYRAFNSIRYNTPLVLMDGGILDMNLPDEGLLKTLLNLYEKIVCDARKKRKIKIEDSVITVEEERIEAMNIIRPLHAAAFSDALHELYKEKIEGKEATTENIREIFTEIYNEIGLKQNRVFMDNDLYTIEDCKQHIGSEWKILNEIFRECWRTNKEQHATSEISERNFFAHSGLERNSVEVRTDGEKIFLRYRRDEKIKRKILSILGNR